MKRSYDDANPGSTSATRASPSSSGEPSPTIKKGRTSNSPGVSAPAPLLVPSVFTDSTGRITRIPTISRKVRACSACKKQKIRCDFEEGEQTCVRCKKMKLECVVNRSLQTILDEDVEWKHRMREDTVQLQRAMEDVLQVLNLRPLPSYIPISPAHSRTSSEAPRDQGRRTSSNKGSMSVPRFEPRPNTSGGKMEDDHRPTNGAFMRETSPEPHEIDSQTLFSNPMGSVYEVTKLQNLRTGVSLRNGYRSDMDADFITRGLITLGQGQELFDLFRDTLNHYLYSIALVHDELASARCSSSLLTSAIFTVASLHLPQYHHLFPMLYREFLALVATTMFDRCQRLDDIRGLCIGAFWLMDVSWKLSGYAVRIATEFNIHQSFRKAVAGSKEHFERARLWYLLYVCDHHFSITYGRPPVIHDHEPMTKYEEYLNCPMAIEGDRRVLSQVTLHVLLTEVYRFYEDEDSEIPEEKILQLGMFLEKLDDWQLYWRSRLRRNDFVGDYPRLGVQLHYNFAKLQACSLTLRGACPNTIQNLTPARKEYANMAIESAIAVLNFILDEPNIRESLVGVPLYINTMVAFASVFLLKITAKWKSIGFKLAPNNVWSLVERVIAFLKSRGASENHIVPHVAAGLEDMLRKCVQFSKSASPIDDSRLWDNLLPTDSANPSAPGILAGAPPPTVRPSDIKFEASEGGTPPSGLEYSVGQPPPPWHGYAPAAQPGQMRSGSVQGHDAHVMYPPHAGPPPPPPHMAAGPGQPAMYEMNGQYFPMHMGVFDFLSPQLPY